MLSLMCYANSVDVLDDGGIVRYGRVVDLADNGLFVDLLYPHQRREYFPFERLLLNPASSLLESPCPTEFARLPVEVLVPAMSVGALVWLAGEAVNLGGGQALGRYDGAIVHWVCPDGGGPCTDFLPLSRIRWPQTAALAAQRHVRSDTFGKRSLALDDAFPSLSAEEAAELIKRLNNDTLRDFHFPCDANVVELVERRLEYIYQPDLEESGRYDPRGLRYLVSLASFQAELIRLSALSDEIPATCDEVALPMKVWRQVFAHLDTVTQMGLRAVCGEWQRALDEPELSGRLWVGDYAESQRCFDHFRALATLYHRLQADTQDLVVQAYDRRSPLEIQETMMLCQMVHYVAQHRRPGIRLRSLHLHRCQWYLQINGGAATRDAHAECVLHQADPATLRDIDRRSGYQLEDWIAACGRLPCDAVHLSRCAVDLHGCCFLRKGLNGWKEKSVSVEMDLPTTRLPMGGRLRRALWEAMDSALPAPPEQEQELRALLIWLNLIGDEKRTVVCTMLCALQSADPRPSAHYRGKKWCVDGVEHLQLASLAKLSRITRHFLVQMQWCMGRQSWFRR